jgi:hypothetical protein
VLTFQQQLKHPDPRRMTQRLEELGRRQLRRQAIDA